VVVRTLGSTVADLAQYLEVLLASLGYREMGGVGDLQDQGVDIGLGCGLSGLESFELRLEA
jgi:hypothetical protein